MRPLTTITLYAGVPFDKTYKHIINWSNENQLLNYLNGFPHVSERVSRQNLNKPIRWDTRKQYHVQGDNSQLNLVTTFNQLTLFNYVQISIQEHDGNIKNYYAYITNLEYFNDGTTFIYFSVDMWNTYFPGIDWNHSNAMVQRGFVQELNDSQNDFSNTFNKVKNMPDEIGGDGCEFLQLSAPVGFHKVKGSDMTYRSDTTLKFVLFIA